MSSLDLEMSVRLDLVIFGASGYTGKHVVKEFTRIARSYPEITWAVAGRSKSKLEVLLQNVAKKTGYDLSAVKIITADVDDDVSLKNMCNQVKVVVNCCGPFIKYGEAVVAAAVKAKAHYVDVSAETHFFELLQEKYNQAAQEAGVFIISSCGLTSLPADLGVLFLEQNFGGTLNAVESYLITYFPQKMLDESRRKGVIRYSTWESTINSLAYISLKRIRNKPSFHIEPEIKQRVIIHKNFDKWCLPFPATDRFMIEHTQRHLLLTNNKHPVQYRPYLTFPSIFLAIGAVIGCMILFFLSKMTWSKKFLLKYPRLCSLGLVTYEDTKEGVMDDAYFQYEMIGSGWNSGIDLKQQPDKKMTARICASGVDPSYIGTSVVVIFAALTILKEKDKMPSRPGVLTAGVAFRKTNIIKHLNENNINFEIVPKSF